MSLIAVASSVGASIFSYFAVKFVNPNNLKPTEIVHDGNVVEKYYDYSVSQNYPTSLMNLLFLSLAIFVIGLICVYINPLIKHYDSNNKK